MRARQSRAVRAATAAESLVGDLAAVRKLVMEARARSYLPAPELDRAELLLLLAEMRTASLVDDFRRSDEAIPHLRSVPVTES